MAKRDRVPGRKSLGGGGRRRNKNPKLSPFQREQKRDRLANQPPIEPANKRDYPGKQRAVYEYLIAREEREAAKKEKRKREEAEKQEQAAAAGTAPAAPSAAVEEGKARKRARKESDMALLPPVAQPPVEEPATKKTKKKKGSAAQPSQVETKKTKKDGGLFGSVQSLNEELREGAAPIGDRLDVNVLKKKEKKHQKRLEQRKERITARMESIEREALEALNRKRVKRGADQRTKVAKRDEAYERELVKMQKEKAKEDAQTKRAAPSASSSASAPVVAADYLASPDEAKKRITFASEADQGPSTAHTVARPARLQPHKSFHQMIDIVRFGERVDAPPVFNALPDKQAAISKLAAKLHEEEMRLGSKKKPASAATSAASDHRRAMLGGSSSGVSDPSSFNERRRLASLGLAPRVSGTVVTESVVSSKPSATTPQQNEFERLRQKVQESYQRNKALRYGGRGGSQQAGGSKNNSSNNNPSVNLKHEFPQI